MAITGMSFVEAINELVETVNEFPMSGSTKPSGSGDTTSIYARAETFIDRESRRIQALGWPENTTLSRAITAESSAKTVLVEAYLSVRAAGPDQHRNLVMRSVTSGSPAVTNTKLYDADKQSFDITSANDGTVYLDTVENLDFEYLPNHLQDVIVARAKMTFQRRIQGNSEADQQLMQEYAQAEQLAFRNKPDLDQNFNIRPSFGAAQEQQQG